MLGDSASAVLSGTQDLDAQWLGIISADQAVLRSTVARQASSMVALVYKTDG